MAKIICYGEEARYALERGVNQLADTVRIIMGPKGHNMALDKKFGAPPTTNDGVTIVKETEFDDPSESTGAQLVEEVFTKTNDVTGDGITTATLLAQAITHGGLKNLAAGVNPMVIKKGIAKATAAAVKVIKVDSRKVNGSASIARVGTVSSSDETVGKLIVETTEKVSHDGAITAKEPRAAETYPEVVGGMQFDRGYITPYMVIGTEKMEAVLDDALTLTIDKKISNVQELLPILEQVVQLGKKLLVTAEDAEGEVLSTLIVNKLRGTLNVVCAKAPGFGDRRKETLEDIAVPTSGTVITSDMGYELKEVIMGMLGRTRQVKVPKENTIIADGTGSADAIKACVNQIKSQIEATAPDYDRERLRECLARVADGVAIVHVGAATEVEMKEKKLRIEDTLNAIRVAVEEGIVTGDDTAYVNVTASVEKLLVETEGDKKTGVSIIVKALTEPMRQTATDAGIDGSVVLENVKKADKVGYGFDAYNETYVDMISVGIVDPTRVTRSALENAASIAATLLITESLVADKPQPPTPVAPAVPDMGGMY